MEVVACTEWLYVHTHTHTHTHTQHILAPTPSLPWTRFFDGLLRAPDAPIVTRITTEDAAKKRQSIYNEWSAHLKTLRS